MEIITNIYHDNEKLLTFCFGLLAVYAALRIVHISLREFIRFVTQEAIDGLKFKKQLTAMNFWFVVMTFVIVMFILLEDAARHWFGLSTNVETAAQNSAVISGMLPVCFGIFFICSMLISRNQK